MDLRSLSNEELLQLYAGMPADQAPPAPAPATDGGSTTADGRPRITVTPRNTRPISEWSDAELLAARDAAASQPSVAEDVAKSAGIGVVKGGIGLAGTLGDVREAAYSGGSNAMKWLAGKLGATPEQAEAAGQNVLNALRMTPNRFPTSAKLRSDVESVTGPLYEPKTTAGEYAQTAGEFIPGAIMGPGGVARNAVRFGVVPGLASEAAGQATKGTAAEPWARAGAALTTAGGAALLTRPRSAEQAIRGSMPEGVTPQVINEAQRLIDDAAARGISLTWPEAIERVAPGQGVGLLNTQRILESSRQTSGELAPRFAERPGQIDQAARAEFDQVAPRPVAPSAIGPAAGEAAESTLNDVRGAINQATGPLYDAARQQRIDPQLFAQVRNDPVFQEGLRRVRNDPFIGPTLRNAPDDSVAVVDAVKKQLDETGRNLRDPMAGTARNNYAAGIVEQGTRRMVRAADISTGSVPASLGPLAGNPSFPGIMGSYETARAIQAEARQRFLEPLLQGPIGKLAGKDRTTQAAIDALFPKNPFPGSENEIATAVAALAQRSPRVARELVRAHVESVFDRATRNLQGGANQWGGGSFAAALVGNQQEAANLQAAIRALPNGDRTWAGFNRFLEIVQATGARQRIGSRTAFNAEDLKALAEGRALAQVGKAASAPQRFLTAIGDAWDKWQLGRNLGELSRILTDPQSAGLLRDIANRPVGSRAAQIMAGRLALTALASQQSGADQRRQPQ